jgi:hypothetical protein
MSYASSSGTNSGCRGIEMNLKNKSTPGVERFVDFRRCENNCISFISNVFLAILRQEGQESPRAVSR